MNTYPYPNFLKDLNEKFTKFKNNNPLECLELSNNMNMYMSEITRCSTGLLEMNLNLVPNNPYAVCCISPIAFRQTTKGDYCSIHINTIGHSFSYQLDVYSKGYYFYKSDAYGWWHSNENDNFEYVLKILKTIFNIKWERGKLFYDNFTDHLSS